MISHGIKAMHASAQDTELTEHNVSIGVLGKDQAFKLLSKDELKAVLSANADE